MANIMREIPAKCPKCDKDVDFQIALAYVKYNGIIPILWCPSCKVEVPAYSFNDFLNTGKVIIGV